MEIDKDTTVAFTGYRLSKLLRGGDMSALESIAGECRLRLEQLYADGYRCFLSGMSSGFDLIAAEQVLLLKRRQKGVRLVAVVPFVGQESGYSAEDRSVYERVLSHSDEVVVLHEAYQGNFQYLKRNDYLLDHASALLCYYDGQRGGTMYTYNRAVARSMRVVNICSHEQLLIPDLFHQLI
ncbi:MAG: SLOG family protein [Rikenellaceae bacterium]